MTLDKLIEAGEALRGTHGGQAPIVVDFDVKRPALIGGATPLVRTLQGEVLAQLQPSLYARTESFRFVVPAVAIKT
jgi:hypothetical protein